MLVVLVRRKFILRYIAVSAQASIAGQITVQVDGRRDARPFGVVEGVVDFAGLTKRKF